MYKFIDVNEASEGLTLPSEALKLNGEYIENQIEGYRTLHVSGREALSPELNTYDTGIRDGSTIQNKRYPARVIIITYQLIAKSNEDFREAYNKLGSILNVEDAQLIFNDEQDKYYTGTPSAIGEVEPGTNKVVGEIEIYCADPFKYSVEEYEIEPSVDDDMSFLIDYKGTYKSYPTLEARFFNEEETNGESETALTGNGDCGYVAFFNDEEKIIQLGDPEESDGEEFAKSQTLVNQGFSYSYCWGTATRNLWKQNVGITSSASVVQAGTLGLKLSNTVDYYLTGGNFGSGAKWHGPSATRTIPADATGEVGAKNFTLTYKHKMSIGKGKNDIKQRGAFQCLLVSGSGTARKIVAGVNVYKDSDGNTAKLRFYINGVVAYTMNIDLSYRNPYFGNNNTTTGFKSVKNVIITKTGKTVDFNVGGIKRSFTNSAIENLVVKEATFTFTQWGTKTPLSFNGIYNVKFVKNNCDTWRDVPNKFSANDIITANCKNGEILLNDAPTPEYGALGNDWEEFYLRPGLNQIGVAYSDWVDAGYEPTFKMRYREVFL